MTLPSGTITFLFTDIEGSTLKWERYPDAMRLALVRHDELLRQAIELQNGHVFKTVGDAFCAAFSTATEALYAALEIHLALLRHGWGEVGPIRVRIGLHTGEADERDNDYFGQTVIRVARLHAVAHGQQTLISQATYELVRSRLPDTATLTDLGNLRFKDLSSAEHVWQLLHPSLPAEFPPLKSLDHLPNNLPRQLTSFIGREHEMASVKALLETTSLLTLTGSGGTGKTRLSLHAAADVVERYSDGVWLVELAPLSDPALIPQTVADVVGVREASGESITKTLISALKAKQMLLVLDNCEHLLDASVSLVDALLKSCPNVRVMVSSREVLGISGETIYRVPSLSLPESNASYSPESLLQFESVCLFVERAEAVKPDFTITRRNTPALASVCNRLDGIPLAIELAAARVRSLTVEQIASHLDNRFRLLTGGSKTALPRQQTLRAMIDWSYDLLDENQKALLRRLSVFMGGWRLEAAEAVCSCAEVEEGEVLDLLTALVDKSLVVTEVQGQAVRYRLLETVRQYARDRLVESGESDNVFQRHRDFFLVLAEDGEPNLTGPVQGEWLERLDQEYENLRGALEWSLGARSSAEAQRFCGTLWRFWATRGHLFEGRGWCGRAIEGPGNVQRTQERGDALNGAGALAIVQGDYAYARACNEESLSIRREIGDKVGIAGSLSNLGLVATLLGEYGTARQCSEESLDLFREIGERRGIAFSLNALGVVAHARGDYIAARAYYEESLHISRVTGNLSGAAASLGELGSTAYCQGDFESATLYISEGLTISREIGNLIGIGRSLIGLAKVACTQEDYETARSYCDEGLSVFRDTGDKRGIADTLEGFGDVALSQSEYAAARAYGEESLSIRRETNDRYGIASSLESLARLLQVQHQPDRAVRLWGASEALREQMGAPLPPNERTEYDRAISAARQSLGDDEFHRAWAAGRAMSMELAIELALETDGY